LFTSLALEVLLVFALTALLARLVRSASGQRMVWRVSFVVLGALVLAEFSGVGHSLLQHPRPSPPASVQQRTFVVTTSVTADTPQSFAPLSTALNLPVSPTVNSQEKLLSSLARWLPVLALAGFVWVSVRRSFGALRLIRLGRQAPVDSSDLAARVQALGRRLGIRRHVRLKSMEGLSSPIAFGIFRPTVGVPKDFSARFTAAQQEAMLAHELAHVAAFDAVWMLLADLVTALLWWHPGAWWARRHLRAASETAADEASLLLDDGPATLAECLVTLGDLLTRSPDPGGLGMAGYRFRSELGRRVERLLKLRGPTRRPWRGATAWVARLLVPAALLALALAFTAWLLPPVAGADTFGEAFLRSPLGLATTALLAADQNDAPRLLLEGKKLHDAGKTNEAEAKWRTALELDPGNKVALDFLGKIGRTNFPAAKPAVQPSAPPISHPLTGTNPVSMSNARQKIYQKLNTIRLDPVMFDGVPLTQALEIIKKDAKNRDPEKKGVNIILSTTADPQAAAAPAIDPSTGLPVRGVAHSEAAASPAIDPTTGLPVAGAAAGTEWDINATTVKINPELNDVTLGQLLDIIVKVADRPIKYSIEDFGVLFTLRGAEVPVLHTRWFKIEPNTFMHGLQGFMGQDFGRSKAAAQPAGQARPPGQGQGQGQGGQAGIDFLTVQTPQEIVSATVRTYFQTAGVTLDPPKSVIFNDRLGMLMVRATLADLDLIEQAVQVLNMAPPQVVIEVKFCEVPEELLAAPGLKLQPAPAGTNSAGTNVASTTLTSILTPEQSRNVLRALEQTQGVNIHAPKILTPSGRQAQIKTVDVRTIVTGLDLTTNAPPAPGQPAEHPPVTEQIEFGPILDVVPYVAADGRTIQMTVIPSIKEFIGYDVDYAVSKGIWDYLTSPGANPPPRSQMYPLPIFRLRQIVLSTTVKDGQTLVLASRAAKTAVPDSHIANKLPKELTDQLSASIQRMQKPPPNAMLVFITPTIVDPAGNRVHTDAELPAHTNSVPSLLPPALK
jgi:beta-lactamase regulating signal transducer with metallopeptidase domain